jgi:hypothetical protein
MEPDGSLPCSQELSTGPILSQINPEHTTSSCPRSISVLSIHLCLDLRNGFFPSGFLTSNLYALLKNGVFWDVTPCSSCKNRRFGGTYRLHNEGDKNRRAGTTLLLMMETTRSSETSVRIRATQKTAFFK